MAVIILAVVLGIWIVVNLMSSLKIRKETNEWEDGHGDGSLLSIIFWVFALFMLIALFVVSSS